MKELRMKQLKDGTGYVRGIFGRDVPAILTDREGDTVWIYSNRPLSGYTERDGVYVREFDASSWNRDELKEVGVKWHFIQWKRSVNGVLVDRPIKIIERRIGVTELKGKERGYAHVASREFAISCYDFPRNFPEISPEDALLVHEATHGIIHEKEGMVDVLTGYGSQDIFRDYDSCYDGQLDLWVPPAVNEALAVYMELSFMQRHYPQLIEDWKEIRRSNIQLAFLTKDLVHSTAHRLVIENGLPFEEIIGRLKTVD